MRKCGENETLISCAFSVANNDINAKNTFVYKLLLKEFVYGFGFDCSGTKTFSKKFHTMILLPSSQ